MLVQSSSNWCGDEPVRLRSSRCEKSGTTGQHRGPRKAERFEILAVELRVAQRQLAAVDVRVQLAPAAEALARQRAVHADEILRRRDVVVDERHPIGQRVRRSRRLRADREMVQQQVVRMAGVDQLAVVAGQRFEPRIGRLDEDVRLDSRPRAARAGCRALRGRSRRRSRAWPAPDGRPGASRRLIAPARPRWTAAPARRAADRAAPVAAGRARRGSASAPAAAAAVAAPGSSGRGEAPRRATTGPAGSAATTSRAGGQSCLPPLEPAGQRLERRGRPALSTAARACRGTSAR